MDDLHKLPHFDDTLGYLYVAHATIERKDSAVMAVHAGGAVQIPAASLSVLMLGPGTSITHAAVYALADNNCPIVWCGEEGVRFYAQGVGGTRGAAQLLHQAKLATTPALRLLVVRRMYEMRFAKPLPPSLTIEQVRGMEGIRVREAYARASRESGVPWKGRSYDRMDWSSADPVNRAISAGNACLYGLVGAAITSLGYSAALGFIHTGKQLSFVYDIADLYKIDLVVPAAFELARTEEKNVEQRMRRLLRDRFHSEKLMSRIVPDIQRCLSIDGDAPSGASHADSDPSRPENWWTPDSGPAIPLADDPEGPTGVEQE